MNAIRQGTIASREDGWACAWYEIKTKGGGIYSKVEEDSDGQERLEVGTVVWFGMEADTVGYFATAKPKTSELVSGVIKKARTYGEERIWLSIRTEENGQVRYHVARPWLATIFGELGQRLTREQRERLVRSIEGQRYKIRLWPRSPWFADVIQRRIRPPRRKVPPRLKAVTSSESVSEVKA